MSRFTGPEDLQRYAIDRFWRWRLPLVPDWLRPVFAACFSLTLLSACDKADRIEANALVHQLRRLHPGDAAHVSRLLDERIETVCVFEPYSGGGEPGEPSAEAVNRLFADPMTGADDSKWSLVIVRGGVATRYAYPREYLDVLSPDRFARLLPAEFRPLLTYSSCVSRNDGFAIHFVDGGRNFVALAASHGRLP